MATNNKKVVTKANDEKNVAPVVAAAKPEVKKDVVKEETKVEVKPATAPKAETKVAPEKAEAKKAEPKKTETKKAATPKKTTTKAAKKEVTQTVYVQFAGKEVAVDDMMPKVKKVWQKAGRKIKDIEDVKMYVKPEDNKVYFVINGSFIDSIDFE